MPSGNGHGGRRRGSGRPRGAVGRQDRVLRASWASVARKHAEAATAALHNPNAESALVRLSFASAKIVLPRGTHLALSQLKNGTVGP
jgi:hypothetical protein